MTATQTAKPASLTNANGRRMYLAADGVTYETSRTRRQRREAARNA